MMTDKECIEAFEALSTILEEQGLGWLVEAVGREIHEGMIELALENDFTPQGSEPPSYRLTPEYRRAIRKAEFLFRREFSQADRLRLLVDAVREVISQARDIEQDILHFFRESRGPMGFQFADAESPVAQAEKTSELVGGRSVAARQLEELLLELRQEIPR